MAESTDTDGGFPEAPPLPERRQTVYQYDENTLHNRDITDQMYEVPDGGQIFEHESQSDFSELSDLKFEKFPSTRKLCAINILFSTVFGLSGGLIGAQLLENSENTTRASSAVGCSCSRGHVVFAYTLENTDRCYAVADGSTDNDGFPLPNLLQNNGLFVRAGYGSNVGSVESDSVSLSGVQAQATSLFSPEFENLFQTNGNENEEGYFLGQSAIFGITGSRLGKKIVPEIFTNISFSGGGTETKPVSIRLLPLVCVGP